MDFPSWPSILAHSGFFFVGGSVCLVVAAASGRHLARRLRGRPGPAGGEPPWLPRTLPGLAAGTTFAFLLGAATLLGACLGTWHEAAFRGLDPAAVTALEVARAPEEQVADPSVTVTLTDRAKIRQGLALLRRHGVFYRNHERFRGGYRITLHGPSGGYRLWVFGRGDRGREAALVRPAFADEIMLGCDYEAADFVRWVREEIDPLFRGTGHDPR